MILMWSKSVRSWYFIERTLKKKKGLVSRGLINTDVSLEGVWKSFLVINSALIYKLRANLRKRVLQSLRVCNVFTQVLYKLAHIMCIIYVKFAYKDPQSDMHATFMWTLCKAHKNTLEISFNANLFKIKLNFFFFRSFQQLFMYFRVPSIVIIGY